MLAIELVLALCLIPTLTCTAYLFILTVLSSRRPAPIYPAPGLRFDVVVPAHNEQINIAATVSSLLGTDYPPELRRVLVIADNCSDATAERGRAAGAMVLTRTDEALRGKGYALAFAFDHVLREGIADVVVVVDADTTVSPNLFRAFAARFVSGADAVQAEYGVRNRNASWRTRLMAIALAMFHDLRSLARERMKVSAGLRGNGMGFRTRVLRDVPHDSFSIVEDLEYGIRLGKAGVRVHYVDEARVLGEMAVGAQDSRSQRSRWEGGRMHLARIHGPALLAMAVRRQSLMLFDLAMDVLVLPLSYIALAACLGTIAASASWAYWPTLPSLALAVAWAASIVMLVAYVVRGVVLSGAGMRGFLDLAMAPAYVAWKLALALSGGRAAKKEWVRTARQGEKAP